MGRSSGTNILSGASKADDPKRRTFETLDGMRGVAALAVLLWHIPSKPFLNSAYLAVDLFFMLSGFVIAYRYDDRLKSRADGKKFMIMRIIRLWPLYLLGSAIGAAYALLNIYLRGLDSHLLGWAKNCVLAFLMLPSIFSVGSVFKFNYPAWSLFYEVLVNIIYGYTVSLTSNRVLILIVLASAAALTVATFTFGNMHFTITMPKFLLGFFRATFGFYVGIGIYRLWKAGKLPAWQVHPFLIAVMLLLSLAIPRHGDLAPYLTLAVVYLLFPTIVILSVLVEPRGWLSPLFRQLGLLSFPLYAIHYPIFSFVRLMGGYLGAPQLATSIASIGISIIFAWLAMHLFDQPVRNWLTAQAQRRFL